MIDIKNVKKYYGSRKNAIRAIDDVSLHVSKGEFVVVTGPSGSGKTTFLNLIGGMTSPDSGEIIVSGQNIHHMKDNALSVFRADHLGFIFQFQSMVPTLNTLENVLLPKMFSRNGKHHPSPESLLEKVGLADRMNAFAHELSAGQKRRVSIARALVNAPEILICDEPTGDLDPETESVIMALICQANQDGATIILTTHNHQLRKMGHRNYRIINGKIFEA